MQDKQKKNAMEKREKESLEVKGPIKEWRNKCSENAVALMVLCNLIEVLLAVARDLAEMRRLFRYAKGR